MGFWSASSTGTGSAAKAGAVIGSLDIGAPNMVLSILSGDATWQMAIKGLVLLLAVAFGIFNKRRSGGR